MRKILVCLALAVSAVCSAQGVPITTEQVNDNFLVGAPLGNYNTVQQGVTGACAQFGAHARVTIIPSYGGSDSITAATGCQFVTIVDQRGNSGDTCYSWGTSGPYAASACTASGSSFNLPAALAASPYCVTTANAGEFLLPDGSTNGVMDCVPPTAFPSSIAPDQTNVYHLGTATDAYAYMALFAHEFVDNSGNTRTDRETSGTITSYVVEHPLAVGGTGQTEVCTTTGAICNEAWKTICQSSGTGCPTPAVNGITALTGDVTATGPGSAAATLATVNTGVTACGDATHSCQITTTNKGLVISNSSIPLSSSYITNPMTTMGDMIYGGASGTPTRLAGPTALIATAYFPCWQPSGTAIAPTVCNYQTILNSALVPTTAGGTALDTHTSTGVAQVNSGTWSVSTALANGTTATTQSAGDNSTKLATTAFTNSIFAAPPAIGSTTPAAGTFTTANTLKATVSAANGAATTILTFPGVQASYYVACDLPAADNAPLFGASAVLEVGGATTTFLSAIHTAPNNALAMSGLNLQATQTAGSTTNVTCSALRIL